MPKALELVSRLKQSDNITFVHEYSMKLTLNDFQIPLANPKG